jgi:hypothetical protein
MLPENVKIDPDTGEAMVDPDTGEYIIEKPEDKPGEKKEEQPSSQYSDEELARVVEEMQAEILRQEGIGEYKDLKEFIEEHKRLKSLYQTLSESDKLSFPITKRLAEQLGVTPIELMKSVEDHLTKKGTVKPSEKPTVDEKVSERDMALGRMQLDLRFERFQRKMEKREIDIPDELQSDLEKLLPKVLTGLSPEEINKIDPFAEAYELYLFRLSKSKSPEEVEEKLRLYKAAQLKLKHQLKIPGVTPSKKKTESQVKEEEAWGAGISNLPEPSKK